MDEKEVYFRGQRPLGGITDLLAMPGIEDVEFEVPEVGDYPRPADLS